MAKNKLVIEVFETKDAWEDARKGRITGTKLKDITIKKYGTGLKKGIYELVAQRIEIEEEGEYETPMDRGTRLEPEAIQYFMDETGKDMDTSMVIWSRADNPAIASSPDAFEKVAKGKPITEAVEAKCLSSASHIEAWHTGEIPEDYAFQVLQYFIVNEDLQRLFFVFYDPRIPAKPFFYHEVTRESKQEEIDTYLEHEREVLGIVEKLVNELTF